MFSPSQCCNRHHQDDGWPSYCHHFASWGGQLCIRNNTIHIPWGLPKPWNCGNIWEINHHQFIYPVSPWESELRCPKMRFFYRHSLRNVFLNLRESSKSRGSDAVKGPLWTFILHCYYHVLASSNPYRRHTHPGYTLLAYWNRGVRSFWKSCWHAIVTSDLMFFGGSCSAQQKWNVPLDDLMTCSLRSLLTWFMGWISTF